MKNKITIYFFLIICLAIPNLFASNEFKDSIVIQNSKFSYSNNEKCSYINCIGELANLGEDTYQYITLQIQYFNEKDEIIDTVTEQLYDHVLMPKETISFKVSDRADKSSEQYITHKVKVTYADEKYVKKYEPVKKKSWILDILISWGPMLLLIFVWIFIMYRYNRNKKSPHFQSVEAMKKRNELVEYQNKLFEKLIKTIEQNNNKT